MAEECRRPHLREKKENQETMAPYDLREFGASRKRKHNVKSSREGKQERK